MKTITMAAGALAVLMTSGASFAQEPTGTQPVQPQTQATPTDDTIPAGISADDFLARAQERFERLDADGDGTLTREERRAGRPDRGDRFGPDGRPGPRMAERGPEGSGPDGFGPQGPGPRGPGMGPAGGPEGGPMARMDSDGDGKITVEDFVERAEERFAQLDENGDGEIAPDEMKRPPHHGPRGPRHAREDGWKHGPHHARFDRGSDRDGGGSIDEEQFMQNAQERFDAMDANGDGAVTREERRDAREDRGYGNAWRHHWR